ncbi:hypothetical protein BDM02DRAFT_3114074 [Thelephora ganbajun]|uniref:Uncharacterized protein n=1 Tax=Thelephora ganbajun TaxID=370292 RepID=A0ACB6ZI75_THEGA|nr:hypothetical protein BDM02DRAFT_3114074 [Thelephora ganbajun]
MRCTWSPFPFLNPHDTVVLSFHFTVASTEPIACQAPPLPSILSLVLFALTAHSPRRLYTGRFIMPSIHHT